MGYQGYANASFECCIRIKGTMMDRDPFVAVTPKENLWIRISVVMDQCHCCACNRFRIQYATLLKIKTRQSLDLKKSINNKVTSVKEIMGTWDHGNVIKYQGKRIISL